MNILSIFENTNVALSLLSGGIAATLIAAILYMLADEK